MKILIVKLGAIGDIIHTLPALAAIRRELPSAEISWVAEQRSSGILQGNELIDHLIEVDTRSLRGGKVIEKMLIDAAKQVKSLRRYDFDVAIDFQGLLKSGMIAKLSGAGTRWGLARAHLREPAARVFYTNTLELDPPMHVIRRNLSLAAAAVGLSPGNEKADFPIYTSDTDRAEADAVADQAEGDFVILNPAGGWVTKLWPAENYGRLADLIWENYGWRSIVAIGPNETDLGSRVVASTQSGRSMLAQMSLKGFFELARRARVYVGGDTGPTHLAIAARAPVVGIFGPTEWWRNGSLDANDICVERLDIGCRVDCHRRTCSNWICMEIPPETVFERVQERLKIRRIEGG